MEYSINGLPLNFYYAKAPASTSRSISPADLADKYGYENFATGYVDASGGVTSSAWGIPTESEYYWSKSFFPLATPESATLPIKDSTTYSRYKEIDIMTEADSNGDLVDQYKTALKNKSTYQAKYDDVYQHLIWGDEGYSEEDLKYWKNLLDQTNSLIAYLTSDRMWDIELSWNGDESINSTTLKSNSRTIIKTNDRSTSVCGDGAWLFIQAPGGGGGGGDNYYIAIGTKGKPGGGGGGGGAAGWIWFNTKKLYQEKGAAAKFLISCENWLGGTPGQTGAGFSSGTNGSSIEVRLKTGRSDDLILTVGGGFGGGGHAWDEGGGHIGTGGSGGEITINNPDLFYAYAYINPLPELIGNLDATHVGIDGCAGGNGSTDRPDWNPTYPNATAGASYDPEYALILNPIDNSQTYLRTRTEYSQYYGVGSDRNGIGGGGGASVACILGNQGYGYGGKGSQSADAGYEPTFGGRGVAYILENSYNYLNAPTVTRKEVISTLASAIIYTVYNPNAIAATLWYKIGDADSQFMSIGSHESKTIETRFQLSLTSKFALCTDASSLCPPMTSPIVENKWSLKTLNTIKTSTASVK